MNNGLGGFDMPIEDLIFTSADMLMLSEENIEKMAIYYGKDPMSTLKGLLEEFQATGELSMEDIVVNRITKLQYELKNKLIKGE